MFTLMTRNPFAELSRLQRQMANAFQSFDRDFERWGATEYPAINVYEGPDDLMLTAQVPGVRPEDLDVQAVNSVVTIKGERRADDEEDRRYHRREIACGSFVRSIRLPEAYDVQRAEAELKDGVLTLRVPRRPESMPRRLSVKG